MASTYSYNKTEKLKSRKVLGALFTKGKSFSVFPLKVFYEMMGSGDISIKAGVGVSSRNFKKAVDRNRIKRLLRECYRLNKISLHTIALKQNKGVSVFFLYVGKELPDYAMLDEKIKAALQKLEEQIAR